MQLAVKINKKPMGCDTRLAGELYNKQDDLLTQLPIQFVIRVHF